MSVYDQLYSCNDHYFGEEPHPLLLRFADWIPQGGRVLDIGVGQGRNSLPLLPLGCRITGIDESATGIEQARRAAEAAPGGANGFEYLWAGDFAEFEPAEPFDAILAFGLLQILTRHQCASLIHRLSEWSDPGALLMLTAWHVDDPLYDFYRSEWKRAGLHSYRSADGQHRTYLARNEILDLMSGWDVVHHHEGMGREHGHAGGPKHRHGEIELVAVRRKDGAGNR